MAWIKESGGNVDRVDQIKQALGRDITVLSGDDSLTLPIASVGGVGVISVLANLMPQRVKELTRAILVGDFAAARQPDLLGDPLLGLHPTASQRATVKFFFVVAALWVVQVGLGAVRPALAYPNLRALTTSAISQLAPGGAPLSNPRSAAIGRR